MPNALLIVDMQNAFCHPSGSYSRRGYEILNLDRVIAANQSLRDLAYSREWSVVYTRLAYEPGYPDSGLLVARHPEIRQMRAYLEGFDSEIFATLAPGDRDMVITKKRYDAFLGTRLESALRQLGTDRLIVSGLLTNVCVESTVRSAFDLGFEPAVVREATSTYFQELYEASLETMNRHFADIISVNDLE